MTERTNRQPIGVSPEEKDNGRFITFENVRDWITIDTAEEVVYLWGGAVTKKFSYSEYRQFVSEVLAIENSENFEGVGREATDFQDLHLESGGGNGHGGPGITVSVWQDRSADQKRELALHSNTVLDVEMVLIDEVADEYIPLDP